VQTEAVAALEWQLWCHTLSTEGRCTAKALLHHLLVNPPSLTTDLPPLQPVPLTLTLQVTDVRVQLLVETAEGSPTGGTTVSTEQGQGLGTVSITSLQVRGLLYLMMTYMLEGLLCLACFQWWLNMQTCIWLGNVSPSFKVHTDLICC